jgi:molecular chaperone GrpE
VGKAFDPNLHEAMMQEESEEYDEGIISQEVQKGYRINNRVLRHARVVVSKGGAKIEEDKKEENEEKKSK